MNKTEAQRVAMQAEADRKAKESADAAIAKSKAENDEAMAAERAKIEAEERIRQEHCFAEERRIRDEIEMKCRRHADDQAKAKINTLNSAPAASIKQTRHTAKQVITILMAELNISTGHAFDLIISIAKELKESA